MQSAALDEMFHRREDCVQRYHKALLLKVRPSIPPGLPVRRGTLRVDREGLAQRQPGASVPWAHRGTVDEGLPVISVQEAGMKAGLCGHNTEPEELGQGWPGAGAAHLSVPPSLPDSDGDFQRQRGFRGKGHRPLHAQRGSL